MYKGIEASRGIGIGSICLITEHDLSFDSKPVADKDAEKARFNDAIEKFKAETAEMAENIRKNIGPKEAEIMEGHLAMIADPTMAGEMTKMIEAGQCAEAAVTAVCDMFIGMFSKMEDDMMRQRASDISDIKISLLKILLGVEDVDISKVAPGTVLVAHDLTPSMTSQIVKENVVGIITEVGGKTSHSAILARALEIPAVLSIPNICEIVKDKDTAIVDGTEGDVYINPDGDVISQYVIKREEFIRAQAELKNFVGKATLTADGKEVELFCNIGTPKDAKKAIECDGEGIGLFRSEFLFMDKPHLPTEDEQFEAYKEAVETMSGKTVIIRTLDIGGDKEIPYMNLEKEENPFLGYRAVRYCLANTDIYKTQLRGILRASAFGTVKIMVPLVTCVDEIRAVKALVEECKMELTNEGISFDPSIQVGCMIETAAASLIADMLAKEADFFSIGTNDLTQYTMSVDRGNAKVAYLYSAFQPAVLRSIKNIIAAANEAGIPVGMCGEAAADPLMIPLLISFGLDEYSVNPVLVLTARAIISKWSKADADALAEKVLSLSTEKEIVELLKASAK
ncbi:MULTISPECIES: phosphoenolpyruvate--protein phosphotransferase [Pseudobutyrivibrio]|jgi:phosphotransferase system enzyme I (PtsI)|uniref:Phosphoenolpyruvate-protein phosphotransferase n=3 Tax=Pseudobutyrivibrio TaxID=46205 RepID=A0A2G3EBV6_9FIRM|nr:MULTISPECIES: phosphoenolpyruvate--protein phosphotransferase [Pseudobutyrivibrio]MBE5904655.1 phosphoenolpyruvate--protein phosphotransferase [Pseudobutyrivibrio sp.]MBR5953509.1 phosphoenolpyruvate--protein phosphotransferase [Pseudobutyrivibrio sp.]NEX02173.1 phosphoenolpyruvate--protein phosphotransferase [Pseudobutyrivibrio xylanivorans]PHU40772.1 phosphoenolpyruvate--protein phosphotransferase [Pseudobutyrivibrio ruminis]SCY29428.1 phosphotransferase system, enzyme I, PtsI [Pseudobuty